jgi:hypothetical protein
MNTVKHCISYSWTSMKVCYIYLIHDESLLSRRRVVGTPALAVTRDASGAVGDGRSNWEFSLAIPVGLQQFIYMP